MTTPTNYELEHDHDRRMKAVIDRLMAEAPKLEGAGDQTPALECHLILRSAGAIHGVLSVTPEGALRMLTPTQLPAKQGRPGMTRDALIEQFFTYGDVVSIAVERPVTATRSIVSS